MALESIKQITDLEEACDRRKAEAALAARKSVAAAETEGAALLEQRRSEAEFRVKAMMTDAEASAAVRAAAVREETARSCDALKAQAEKKLPAAAEFIVRRVVEIT